MARIRVGPIVGLVTDKTARILIEADSDTELTVDVTAGSPGEGPPVTTRKVAAKANRAVAFDIDGLQAGTTYTIGFDVDNRDERKATVRPIDGSRLRTAVVSCNDAGQQLPPKAWEALTKQVDAGELDLLLHAGNQVYADDVCTSWVQKLGRMDAAEWPAAYDEIREDYRNLYRTAWNKPFMQACLAHTANLMVWDEHDIADCWADKPEFADPGRPEHHIGRVGWEVYREYQRQLWDPEALARGYPGSEAGGVTEIARHTWGNIGVLMLDVRGGRAFRQIDRAAQEPQDGDLPYLSNQQWDVLERALAADGDFGATRTLLVVTPTPVVFIGHRQIKDHLMRAPWGIGEKIRNLFDEVRGSWCNGQYRHEQTRLIDRLQAWKQQDSNRELLLLSGNVGVGGTWDVIDSDTKDVLFRQVIASPVHRPPENWMKFRFVAGHLQHPKMDRERMTDPPRYRWLAREVHRQQNVAYVAVDPSQPAGSAIDSHLDLFA